ncbi:VCBS repeat-containing protein [Streptomyces sp. NPDC037389]|uniref:FG-GAP repeat domain-containing protein n=1 Tax=Streptomyces sp. NPDC037389 TaxID=3155369 RepID=UPI00340BB6E6
MRNLFGRKRGRALSGLAGTTAVAAALVGLAAGTATAGTTPDAKAAPKTPSAGAPQFPLFAEKRAQDVKDAQDIYMYRPNGWGGFKDVEEYGFYGSAPRVSETATVDHDHNGEMDGWYHQHSDNSLLEYRGARGDKVIGPGWDVYNRIFSPGDLGGSLESDLLARDKSGVLWLYLARPDGTLEDPYRVGPGWDQYTDIVGKGSLNGDGRADIVAKDRNGDLWYYKGTGESHMPLTDRVKIGGGWNQYDKLVSTGDVDGDGRSDLLARDKSGVLWLYKGNDSDIDPFENRVKIGGGWGRYNNLF